ncbi:MAG: hypothetical protein COB61_004090 [Thiotrichales bacterium]|nr:hypothetical protein [Thiotrichales bacterium]
MQQKTSVTHHATMTSLASTHSTVSIAQNQNVTQGSKNLRGDYTYKRLERIFKTRFAKHYATTRDVDAFIHIWGRALADLSREQMKLGFLKCERDCMYPPSTPAEFRKLCLVQSSDMGLPDWRKAYRVASSARATEIMSHESTQQTWQHAVIWHTAHDVRLDWWYLSRQCTTDPALKAHFEPVYLDHIQLFAHGKNLSIPAKCVMPALPAAQKPQPSADELASEEAAHQAWRDSLISMGLRLPNRDEAAR